MRKIVISGLIAGAALAGCAWPALAGTSAKGTAAAGPAAAGKSTQAAAFRAMAARYPAGSAAGRIAASLERLPAARALAGPGTADLTAGTGISCASPTACLAVGIHLASSGNSGGITPFAARLHAGAWRAVPVRTPRGASLTLLSDVSCKAATYCLAVGVTASKSSAAGFKTYALTWNGTTLTPVAAPPMPAHMMGTVTSVSCVAVRSCVAAGLGMGEASQVASTIIWTWNGTRWARTTVPGAPGTVTEYTRLHCFSLKSCVLIGSLMNDTGSTGTDTPVAAAWNGTVLTDMKAPLPARVSYPLFSGLSCVSARACAVTGSGSSSSTGSGSVAFAEVWNGRTWTVTKWGGPKGSTDAELLGVSCTSAARCIAVGTHGTAKAAAPAALAWTGSRWTVLRVAGSGAGKAAVFTAVSCPVNGKCVTTGVAAKMNGSAGVPVAGYWNGRAWRYGPMLAAAA